MPQIKKVTLQSGKVRYRAQPLTTPQAPLPRFKVGQVPGGHADLPDYFSEAETCPPTRAVQHRPEPFGRYSSLANHGHLRLHRCRFEGPYPTVPFESIPAAVNLGTPGADAHQER